MIADARPANIPPQTAVFKPADTAGVWVPRTITFRELGFTEPVVLGSTETTSNLGRFYLVEQTYAYPDRDVHIATQFHREDEAWRIHAFNLNVRMTGAADEQVEVVDGPVSGLIGEAP